MKTPDLKITEVDASDFKKRNRRSFLVAGLATLGGLAGWFSISKMTTDRGLPLLLRRANEWNDKFWKATFSPKAIAPPVDADGKPVRFNGDIGMLKQIDYASYRLSITTENANAEIQKRELTLDDVKKMPATKTSFEFKCIEGWAQPVSCKGVLFSDLMRELKINDQFQFAGMTSIDEGYWVSWDMKSLLHPQTLLCYEMNGKPLEASNGAPLRVLSSIKYGVKQIKQVALIEFTNTLPEDYWADEGYQDYLGL